MSLKYSLLTLIAALSVPAFAIDPIDSLTFGDASSESSHQLHEFKCEVCKGTLDTPARRLLPLDSPSWDGGRMSFKMKVDPRQVNYFTARFSGDEITENRLFLFVSGKQIGWRHLGEVDQLDYGTWQPACLGRFYYNTFPLPLDLTQGKTEVEFEIRSSGKIWGYANTWEKYQKDMTEPSRSIFRVYTHTGGYFVPPGDEKQGESPKDPPITKVPGDEVLDPVVDNAAAKRAGE